MNCKQLTVTCFRVTFRLFSLPFFCFLPLLFYLAVFSGPGNWVRARTESSLSPIAVKINGKRLERERRARFWMRHWDRIPRWKKIVNRVLGSFSIAELIIRPLKVALCAKHALIYYPFIIFHVARKCISLFQKCEYRNSIRQRLAIKSDKKS